MVASVVTQEARALPGRRRRLLILAICCLSLFIVGLDNTVVNIALPSIQRELHAPASGLQWIIDAYTLVLASLLMLSGSVADRLGRRRVFQTGLLLFVLGSLLCSVAPDLELLIAFRALQAVGGSMLNPVAMSIITNTFTDPRERAQAIGVWGGVVGLSMALGPLIGGFLVHAAGWPSIFLINVPVGLVACALTFRYVPESRAPRPRRLDPVGQLLVVLLLGAGTAVIIEGPGLGWTSPAILLLGALAVLALLALPWWERRVAEPLIDLRFFRSVPFSGATVTAVCAFAALGGFLFLNTLYLQNVRHYSPVEAGLWTLPMAAMTLVSAPVSGRIVGRRGPRLPLLVAGSALEMCIRDSAAAARVRAVRARLRDGERAHHQRGGLRHAQRPGGGGRRRGLDEPSDRPVAGRRGDRHGGHHRRGGVGRHRFRGRQPCRVVDRDRARGGHPAARPRHHHPLGGPDGRRGGRPPRPGARSPGRVTRRGTGGPCGAATMTSTADEPAGRSRRVPSGARRGTSGLHRAGWWVTPTRGDPRDSATENRPPAASAAGKGETVV